MGKPISEIENVWFVFGRARDFLFHSEILYTEYIGVIKRTRGIETSKYPEERTSIETPLVAASERGPGLV